MAVDARARLSGFGALEHLLADPTIENIHANGCDRVFITHAGASAPAALLWPPPTPSSSS